MTRPSPSQARAIAIGVAIPILVALVTAAMRQYDHSKLDVSRFEKDSIANQYERRADRIILSRIDSTTQIILRTHR